MAYKLEASILNDKLRMTDNNKLWNQKFNNKVTIFNMVK